MTKPSDDTSKEPKPDVEDTSSVEEENVDVEDAVIVEDEAEDFASDEAEGSEADGDPDEFDDNAEVEPEEVETTEIAENTTETSQSEPAPKKSGGFVPLLLGGAVAGGIGYVVATYYPMMDTASSGPDLTAAIEAQAARIEALEAEIANSAEMPDLAPLEDQIASARTELGSQITGLEDSVEGSFAAIEGRLTELEKQPGADGTLSDTALAAYQRELDALRADLEAQKNEVMGLAEQAGADLAAARAEAEMLEQEALAAAQAAQSRAALNRVVTAVETGAPFVDALSDLEASGAEVPEALASLSDGVPTRAALSEGFPDVARAALATARAEGVSEDAGGIGGFLRNQFDVRSTAPREGSDPDAVLSRVEAAVNDGRMADALAEVETLPEVVRAEMTEWTALAQSRADALDAITALSETLNEN